MRFGGWLACAALGLCVTQASAALLDELGVELVYDDNLTRAQLARDIKGDLALVVSAAAGPRFQLSDYDSLSVKASVAAKTGSDGKATLGGLPAGEYTLRVWHPQLEGGEQATARQLAMPSSGPVDAATTIGLVPDFRARRAPTPGRGGY